MDIILQRIVELIGKSYGASKKLATAIGIPSNLITDWKAGRNKSYPKYLPQIAEYYGVSLDWLSGRTDIKNPPAETGEGTNPLNMRINELLAESDDQMKRAMIAFLEQLQNNR